MRCAFTCRQGQSCTWEMSAATGCVACGAPLPTMWPATGTHCPLTVGLSEQAHLDTKNDGGEWREVPYPTSALESPADRDLGCPFPTSS